MHFYAITVDFYALKCHVCINLMFFLCLYTKHCFCSSFECIHIFKKCEHIYLVERGALTHVCAWEHNQHIFILCSETPQSVSRRLRNGMDESLIATLMLFGRCVIKDDCTDFNKIWHEASNLVSSTNFMYFGPIAQQKWSSWLLICCHILASSLQLL